MSHDPILVSPRFTSPLTTEQLVQLVRPFLQESLDPDVAVNATPSPALDVNPEHSVVKGDVFHTSAVDFVWWAYEHSANHPVITEMITDALRLQGWDMQAWKYAMALRPMVWEVTSPLGRRRACVLADTADWLFSTETLQTSYGVRPHTSDMGVAFELLAEENPAGDNGLDNWRANSRCLWVQTRFAAWVVAETNVGDPRLGSPGAWSEPMTLKQVAHHIADWLRSDIARITSTSA